MKKILVLLIIVVLVSASCTRKIATSATGTAPDYDEASFNYVFVEALKQKMMGNAGDALKYLEQCIKINPRSDVAYFQMAQVLIANGDVENAKKYASRALEIDRNNLWYMVMLGGLHYQQKNIDSAIYYYKKAVEIYPERENLKVTLGGLYFENHDYNKANSVYTDLEGKYGVNDITAVSSVRSLVLEKRFEEALAKVKTLRDQDPGNISYTVLNAEIYGEMGRKDDAYKTFEELIKTDSEDPAVQMALADFLLKENNYDQLFMILNNVILNDKIDVEEKFHLFGRMLDDQKLVRNEGDRLNMSLRVLEAAYPEDRTIVMLRPELMVLQEHMNDAAVLLEDIIKKQQDNYFAWEKLLIVYMELKDYGKLTSVGKEASSLFNRSFLAKILYANGALETGQYDVALEELKKAQILGSENKAAMQQVLTMQADAYYRMKDYDRAFGLFEQALKNDSEDLLILNNYAYYLAEQNSRLKEAETMARKVIETEKNNTTYLDTYGWVLYKRGKLKDAARVMESVINSGDQPDAEWYEHYGYILKAQKKCADAVSTWQTALKLDPSKDDLKAEIENCGK